MTYSVVHSIAELLLYSPLAWCAVCHASLRFFFGYGRSMHVRCSRVGTPSYVAQIWMLLHFQWPAIRKGCAMCVCLGTGQWSYNSSLFIPLIPQFGFVHSTLFSLFSAIRFCTSCSGMIKWIAILLNDSNRKRSGSKITLRQEKQKLLLAFIEGKIGFHAQYIYGLLVHARILGRKVIN